MEFAWICRSVTVSISLYFNPAMFRLNYTRPSSTSEKIPSYRQIRDENGKEKLERTI
jgi:hypothetical protein